MGVSRERRSPWRGRVQSTERLGTKCLEGGEGQGKGEQSVSEVRRAAALTAELAVVCDHPPGLRDEPAEHIEAPNMGAGGSHPQAEMMQHSPSASPILPTGRSFFNLAGGCRGGRPRSTTRAQEAESLIDETLIFFVKATGKDEASMRQQLTKSEA